MTRIISFNNSVLLVSAFIIWSGHNTPSYVIGGLGFAYVAGMSLKVWIDEKIAQLAAIKKGA